MFLLMLRGISSQDKLALYQLCHVLISYLISESPNTVTNSRLLGLKHLSRRADYPSQLINRPFSLSGLSAGTTSSLLVRTRNLANGRRQICSKRGVRTGGLRK
jgi:hypothetical protein